VPSWLLSGDPRALARQIGERLEARVLEPVTVRRTYLDSFDWRLWDKDTVLIDQQEGDQHRVTWLHLDGRQLLSATVPLRPRFAAHLPEPDTKHTLADRLEMRALLPRVEVTGEILPLVRSNAQGEVVLRGEVACLSVVDPASAAPTVSLPPRLVLQPVQGHEGELEQATEALQALSLAFAERSPLEEALELLGQRPGDYSSRIEMHLEGHERAESATRELLRQIFAVMLANEPGVRADLDTEFLHDLRVAVRRTRSVLTQLKSVFPKRQVRDFSQRFRWLGQVTGPVRDLDVFLLERLPEGPAPLRALVMERRAEALVELLRALDGEEYARLVRDWQQFLSSDTGGPRAHQPIRAVVTPRIYKLVRQVDKDSRALARATPEELHELRKTCKKLRYLTEFFGSLFDKAKLSECVTLLKGAQSTLGELQDLAVQAQRLVGFSDALADRPGVTLEDRMAFAELVEKLHLQRTAVHQALLENFDGAALRARFEGLLLTPYQSGPT
jgi:CHAD domain-containing protein